MRSIQALWVVALASCASERPSECPTDPAVLYAASDNAASGVGALSASGATSFFTGVDLGRDPALAFSRGRAFFLARDPVEAIFEIEPGCGRGLAKVFPSSASTANAQDIAIDPQGRLWIAQFGRASIRIVDPIAATEEEIDLSPYDPDGNPNAHAITFVDGPPRMVVSLEMLDDVELAKGFRSGRYIASDAKLVAFDVTDRARVQTTTLRNRNPFGRLENRATHLYLASPGYFDRADESNAGIERVRVDSLASETLVSESQLGGSVAEVAVDPSECVAAIVADASTENRTSVIVIDGRTGTVLVPTSAPLVGPTANYDLRGLAFAGEHLFVGDRTRTENGYPVHIFRVGGTCAMTFERDAFLSMPPSALRAIR